MFRKNPRRECVCWAAGRAHSEIFSGIRLLDHVNGMIVCVLSAHQFDEFPSTCCMLIHTGTAQYEMFWGLPALASIASKSLNSLAGFANCMGTKIVSLSQNRTVNYQKMNVFLHLYTFAALSGHYLPRSWTSPAISTHSTSFSSIFRSSWRLFNALTSWPAKWHTLKLWINRLTRASYDLVWQNIPYVLDIFYV